MLQTALADSDAQYSTIDTSAATPGEARTVTNVRGNFLRAKILFQHRRLRCYGTGARLAERNYPSMRRAGRELVPKPFTVLLAVAGIFLAVALPQAADAPLAIIPQAPPTPTPASRSPAAPSVTKATATATPPAKHTITVKFDYDFGRSPACSASITTKCVQQFNVYDISRGPLHSLKLFSIPVPPNPSGQMRSITGTSPQLSFEPGLHFLAVTAQPPAGNESNPVVCMTIVRMKP